MNDEMYPCEWRQTRTWSDFVLSQVTYAVSCAQLAEAEACLVAAKHGGVRIEMVVAKAIVERRILRANVALFARNEAWERAVRTAGRSS